MPAFAAILVHVRDIRAELARLSSRVDGIESAQPGNRPGESSKLLHSEIAQYFNLAELDQLMYGIDIDIEEVNGDGIMDRALKLALYARRHGRWHDLICELMRHRPHVDWRKYQ